MNNIFNKNQQVKFSLSKRILILGVALIMCLSLFAGCGGKDGNKIDISGEIVAGKPMASCQVRVTLDNDTFNREEDARVKVGFGFTNGHSVPSFIELGAVVVVKIEGTGFIITDESGAEYNSGYEREFREYSDSKFVCTLKRERYIPNYYEVFELKLNPDSTSGVIQISATNQIEGTCEVSGDGQTIRLHYAANSSKIAFSTVSIADAQKKIK